MKSTNVIYAEKGNSTTIFNTMIWKNMGSNKNGWTKISKERFDAIANGEEVGPLVSNIETPKVSNDLDMEAEYRKLVDQAKGFVEDKKWDEAKIKFEAAAQIKPSNYLKGEINKMVIASGVVALVSQGNDLSLDDPKAAKAFYEEALALDPGNPEIALLISELGLEDEDDLS